MSDRITLRIGNTTPDDLEIQRFLRLLGQKNLSRQSWIKHAMILGFTQLEKEIGSTDARAVGQHGSDGRPVSRRSQNAQGQQSPGARGVSVERQVVKTEKTAERNDNGVFAPPVQPHAGVQPHAPQPVAASSHPAHSAHPAQSTPFLPPQQQPQSPENRFSRAAPETSGNTETALQPAGLRPADLQAADLQAAASPSVGQTPGAALLTEDELRFSSTAVEQARKLMGSFGKGYDG